MLIAVESPKDRSKADRSRSRSSCGRKTQVVGTAAWSGHYPARKDQERCSVSVLLPEMSAIRTGRSQAPTSTSRARRISKPTTLPRQEAIRPPSSFAPAERNRSNHIRAARVGHSRAEPYLRGWGKCLLRFFEYFARAQALPEMFRGGQVRCCTAEMVAGNWQDFQLRSHSA